MRGRATLTMKMSIFDIATPAAMTGLRRADAAAGADAVPTVVPVSVPLTTPPTSFVMQLAVRRP